MIELKKRHPQVPCVTAPSLKGSVRKSAWILFKNRICSLYQNPGMALTLDMKVSGGSRAGRCPELFDGSLQSNVCGYVWAPAA